ncbi:MAG TPA: tRNA pseudouridine(55) synthase, partial [Candidatus Handelsmanbacteria bacterium]|nr:tRNA pseudouridine(55) synthase [Candidatus Handelsmanbacteria bacterium]
MINVENEGILVVDKAPGPTSHDVVAMARRTFQLRRIGHCGTLDPLASGVLVLCIGRLTRLSDWL